MINANHFTSSAHCQASEQFQRLQNRAQWGQFWSKLTGRDCSLLNLQVMAKQSQAQARHYAGIQLVPIAKIGGSEGRCDDFDAAFRPLKSHNRERWISVAVARSRDIPLPVVDLVQVQEVYFVRDGHHRISVARQAGQVEIEAAVTVWQGDALSTTGQTAAPATGRIQAAKRNAPLLLQLGKWLVTVGLKLQARYGVGAEVPALQGR